MHRPTLSPRHSSLEKASKFSRVVKRSARSSFSTGQQIPTFGGDPSWFENICPSPTCPQTAVTPHTSHSFQTLYSTSGGGYMHILRKAARVSKSGNINRHTIPWLRCAGQRETGHLDSKPFPKQKKGSTAGETDETSFAGGRSGRAEEAAVKIQSSTTHTKKKWSGFAHHITCIL